MRKAASTAPLSCRYWSRVFPLFEHDRLWQGMVSRQERQIVQSWLNWDGFLPWITSSVMHLLVMSALPKPPLHLPDVRRVRTARDSASGRPALDEACPRADNPEAWAS